MNTLLKKIFHGDTTIWIVFITLCILSMILMFSASSTEASRAANHMQPMLRHATFLIVGFFIAYGIHFMTSIQIRIIGFIGLVAALILLIYMQFNGVTINGATRWVDIMGFRFQPSEIAKLSLVIVVASFMSWIKDGDTASEKKWFTYIISITAIFCVLIFMDNISTVILIFGVVMVMMFVGRISFKRLGIVMLVALLIGGAGYGMGKAMLQLPSDSGIRSISVLNRVPTMAARLDRFFISDENTPRFVINDITRQYSHSMIAISRGGIFPNGPGSSIQRDYLPLASSDFIFAILLEEWGLLFGGGLLIFLYLILLFRAGMIASKCNSVFPALLVIGLSLMIVIQAFVNMAVAVGLVPVTGQPLPLISHGGTAVVITSIYFGIILSITRQIKESQLAKAEGTVKNIALNETDEFENSLNVEMT